MYYDPDGPALGAAVQPPLFRVDFVCGGDLEAGSVSGAEPLPLSQLYFCDSCSRIVSRRDLAEDVDSYYCPHCLENMPSSEAMLYGMRCSKCWECPVCACTLSMCIASASAAEQTYHLACGCCRWSSKGRLEAQQPEQLVAKILALERDGEAKKRMAALVDAFRTRAQEQQRERELAQRLRRRSTIARSSFVPGSSSSFAARRFSSALMLRQARAAAAGALDGAEQAVGSGPWRADDLEEPRACASSASAPSATSRALEVPVLEGLTLDELLKAHVEAARGAPLLERMRQSLEAPPGHGDSQASLAQRLQQVSCGYRGARAAGWHSEVAHKGTALHIGYGQLEAPLHHADTWALLPVRKPLLTKRSRRCRLFTKSAEKEEKAGNNPAPLRPCKAIVVKPHINPCSNPPFQKNNVAVAFIPRCAPWAWSSESGVGEGGVARMAAPAAAPAAGVAGASAPRPRLQAGQAGELVFAMANPLDADVEVSIDATFFNPDAVSLSTVKGTSLGVLAAEQNVQVLTKPFTTTIAKFNDLADVHDSFSGEDAAKLKVLRDQDDADTIPDRKMHKILVRLRFKALAMAAGSPGGPGPWVFYAQLGLTFQDTSAVRHKVKTTLRFGMEASTTIAPPPSAVQGGAGAILGGGVGSFAPPPREGTG